MRAGVEALEVENVSLNEVLLHLVKLVPADGIDVATLQLLLEDLRDGNLTEIGADTQEVAVEHECVLFILHLRWELCLVLLLRGKLLRHRRVIITVSPIAHVLLIGVL